jgi:hypothetical protein
MYLSTPMWHVHWKFDLVQTLPSGVALALIQIKQRRAPLDQITSTRTASLGISGSR